MPGKYVDEGQVCELRADHSDVRSWGMRASSLEVTRSALGEMDGTQDVPQAHNVGAGTFTCVFPHSYILFYTLLPHPHTRNAHMPTRNVASFML